MSIAVDPKKCYATGRGIQPRGVRVGDLADIKVHTEGAGEGEVTGTLAGPGKLCSMRATLGQSMAGVATTNMLRLNVLL